MATPNLALSLHSEFVNLILFAACLLKVGFYTGLISILPLALIDTLLLEEPKEGKGVDRGR